MVQLIAHVGRVIEREIRIVQGALERNDVELVRGRAAFADPHTVVVSASDGHRHLRADHVLVAVGTRPSLPDGVAADGETVVTSDGVLGICQLPRTMAVVGAGVIGIEYASMFAALGVQVTVIDQRPRPLEFLDREIVGRADPPAPQSDVTFRCGEAVARIDILTEPKRKGLITLESGKHLVADVILVASGRTGATDGLGLETVGLAPDGRGRLKVDAQYQTPVPHIYAAGDVIGFPALAATSSEQGRLAACHMFGAPAEPMGSNFPVGIYAIPEVSMVGATEQELTQGRKSRTKPASPGTRRSREARSSATKSGMFKMLFHGDDRQAARRSLHRHGRDRTASTSDRRCSALGGGLDYFLTTVFNYPTLAECYKVAAYNAANKMAPVTQMFRGVAGNVT